MATKKQIKAAVKKVLTKSASTPKTISVGKPNQKVETVSVLGIEFEQGSDYQFGKCQRVHDPRVWTFIFTDGTYIMWSRHFADRVMDTIRLTPAQFQAQMYQIVDWDTPIITGAAPANNLGMPMDGGLLMDAGF